MPQANRSQAAPFEVEISRLPNHLSFFRWLSVRIDLAQLPTFESHAIAADTKYLQYTTESAAAIRQFVKYAVYYFNETHKHAVFSPVSEHQALEAVHEIWQHELQEITRTRLLEK